MPDSNENAPAATTVTPTPPSSDQQQQVVAASDPTNNALAQDDNNDNNPHNQRANNNNAGRRLLSSSYRSFRPCELGDRYAAFLLQNERTASVLQSHVLMDHLAVVRQLSGDDEGMMMNLDGLMHNSTGDGSMTGSVGEERNKKRANASIEIDAFQLISSDPVLGNMTLRYPDTLLELLEDSTVDARQVLRGRMESAIVASLERMNRQRPDLKVSKDAFDRETTRMNQLLKALKHTSQRYRPRPLHARLVHLPPHSQFCKPTLSSISASDVGTVVQIRGTCVRAGPVRMMETVRTYKCLGRGCGREFAVHADFGTTNNALPQPIVCPDANQGEDCCSSTSFAVVPNGSEHADYQEMKVQESASALNRVGSVPRSMLVKLSDDLVDRCNPGDEVVVVGNLHAEWQGQSLGPEVEVMVGTSMRAHSVRVINIDEEVTGGGSSVSHAADLGLVGGAAAAAMANASSSGNLREKFRREFDAFWADARARRRPIGARDYITRAVCPKLYGMHAVKLGLLLVLIGGAEVSSGGEQDAQFDQKKADNDKGDEEKTSQPIDINSDSDDEAPKAFKIGGSDDEDDHEFDTQGKNKRKKAREGSRQKKQSNGKASQVKARRRIQSHILLIGDPGTGKSQFLRFAAALSPRSVLTTGTGSSTAGLTCAAVRDAGSSKSGGGNEFSLEAGALALADRGVCCIDEFGCMSKDDRTSIHEAMEQQTISVAKAGIVAKLNARATVVAVMNPNGGLYNTDLDLERNSRLGSALLSRFDLIFVMLDQATIERDMKIADFLLDNAIQGSGYDHPSETETLFNDDTASIGHWSMEKLRAYVATIREKFHPTLTPEASELLENHYSLCRQYQNGQSLVTVRFLESLIRLSQAHARLMYRDKVLLDDAVAVILLMECTAASRSSFQSHSVNNDYYDQRFDLWKNPIDTEVRSFDEADVAFEREKQTLLGWHDNCLKSHSNVTQHDQSNEASMHPFHSSAPNHDQDWNTYGRRGESRPSFADNGQNEKGHDLRDLWGREMLSQTQSPHPGNSRICQSMETMMDPHQFNPASCYPSSGSQPSGNRVTFSQDVRFDSGNNQDMYQNEYRDNSCGGYGNVPNQFNAYSSQQGNFYNPQEHERPPTNEYHHEVDATARMSSQTEGWDMRHSQTQGYNQQDDNIMHHHNENQVGSQISSGKKRKKRRTAD